MSECKAGFKAGDRVRRIADTTEGVIERRSGGDWAVRWEFDHGRTRVFNYSEDSLVHADAPVTLPGGDDCCNRPLPDFFGEADAPEPTPPDGYDRELLEIQLASVHRALSVAHAGLIATPVETVAPTLALGMAMESIESLIRDVRGE